MWLKAGFNPWNSKPQIRHFKHAPSGVSWWKGQVFSPKSCTACWTAAISACKWTQLFPPFPVQEQSWAQWKQLCADLISNAFPDYDSDSSEAVALMLDRECETRFHQVNRITLHLCKYIQVQEYSISTTHQLSYNQTERLLKASSTVKMIQHLHTLVCFAGRQDTSLQPTNKRNTGGSLKRQTKNEIWQTDAARGTQPFSISGLLLSEMSSLHSLLDSSGYCC